jgi:hypothetical protein
MIRWILIGRLRLKRRGKEGIPARFLARDSLVRVHWWSASLAFWWILVGDKVTTRRVWARGS